MYQLGLRGFGLPLNVLLLPCFCYSVFKQRMRSDEYKRKLDKRKKACCYILHNVMYKHFSPYFSYIYKNKKIEDQFTIKIS